MQLGLYGSCPPKQRVSPQRQHHNTDEAGAPELQILRTACVLAGTLGYPEIRLQTPLDSGATLAAAGSRNGCGQKWNSASCRLSSLLRKLR